MESNNETKLKRIISVLVVVVVIFAYYIGYFSARLGFGAPFIQGGAVAGVNNKPADPQEEFKPIEEAKYFDLKGDEVAKGNNNSKIVLVEFTDLQCPFCARFHPTVESLLQKNNLKLVTKHFPLSFHEYAEDYAVMFECLAKNNGSENAYQFVNKLFEVNTQKRGVVTLEDGLTAAKNFGLTDSSFNTCKNDSSIKNKITANLEEGTGLGVSGTPALYILNTETKKAMRVNGAVEESLVQKAIDGLK